MTALDQKLLRDLFRLKTQAVAIALVIACGVATFVMSLSVLRTLERTRDKYYGDFQFAHVFAHLKRAPKAVAQRLGDIPGVAAVQERIVADVLLDIAGMPEPAVGRIVSIPDFTEPALNRLHLRRGRLPEPDRPGEVVVNEAFASAHGFVPGDRLAAVMNGRREELIIVGIGLSPEYIYQIRAGSMFPDDRRFGVFWMRERPIAAAFDLHKAFNDVSLTLLPGAAESEVIRRVDLLLARYGGLGATGRSEQISHRFVTDELTQLRAMAMLPPVIFLLVAAFILNVVLNRLIATQREQIAALKAFGYMRRELGWHYGKITLVIVLCGVAAGIAIGAWLGSGLADMYGRFFRFATLEFRLDPAASLIALGLSIAAGATGVVAAVGRVMRLPPAEAMRPEAPGTYRAAWFERAAPQRWLAQTDRMILRQFSRHPLRATLSVLGIALGVAVMVLGSFGKDVVDTIIAFQFGAVQRYDFSIGFFEPESGKTLHEVTRLPGVLRAEPFRSVPVTLRHGQASRRLALVGLPADRELLRLRDMDGRIAVVPPEGIMLSEKLADLLGLKVGDKLEVEVLEGARPKRSLRVTATLRDFSGLAAYMDIVALNRFMHEGPVISGAFLDTDEGAENDLYRRFKRTPQIGSVSSQHAALRSFRETLSENLLRMRLFNIAFASVIAFGVVYNAARITLSERSREFATLRVIGLTRAEVSSILIGEVTVITLLALPLGLVLGRGLAELAAHALETETQRFAAVVSPATFAAAATTILVSAIVSCFIVRRRIDDLDLIAVLKAHD